MKNLVVGFLSVVLMAASSIDAKAQRPQRTSSAQAAYGNAVPFKEHTKKNNKAKKKAKKLAKDKERRKARNTYRRGIPI